MVHEPEGMRSKKVRKEENGNIKMEQKLNTERRYVFQTKIEGKKLNMLQFLLLLFLYFLSIYAQKAKDAFYGCEKVEKTFWLCSLFMFYKRLIYSS